MAVLQSTSPLKKNNAYGPATSKAGYSASFMPGKSGFLFPTDMDEDDMNDISGIANDMSYAENTLEISLFKNNRSIEPKQPPKYEDENFFENDSSFYAMDDQDQEEFNNQQKAIYMATLSKLDNLQKQQEVSICKCVDYVRHKLWQSWKKCSR